MCNRREVQSLLAEWPGSLQPCRYVVALGSLMHLPKLHWKVFTIKGTGFDELKDEGTSFNIKLTK